jgi:hypothetical protein
MFLYVSYEPVLFLAGAGAIHGDLPSRYGAAEDRPHSPGRPQRLGSALSGPEQIGSGRGKSGDRQLTSWSATNLD